jgi:hypothetical protein
VFSIFGPGTMRVPQSRICLARDVPPLPLRNSAAAKKARMAAALAVIASHLSTRIFTPVYMPAANEGIRELLRACAEVDCKREAMCRALMLSAYEDDEQSQAADSTIRTGSGVPGLSLKETEDWTSI